MVKIRSETLEVNKLYSWPQKRRVHCISAFVDRNWSYSCGQRCDCRVETMR